MIKHMFALFAALVMMLVPSRAQEQTISYQGVIADSALRPMADGTYQVTFRLYESLQATTPVWQEQVAVRTVLGVFDVNLGLTKPLASIMNRQLYMTMQVDGYPETAPRQRLTSVPFAFGSVIADTARNVASDARGLVRSVNGIEGSVELVADTTLQIQRRNDSLFFSAKLGSGLQMRAADNTINVTLTDGFYEVKVNPASLDSTFFKPKSIGRANLADGVIPDSLPLSGSAGGDLIGTYPNPQLRNGAVRSETIANGAVTSDKLSRTGVTPGSYGDSLRYAVITVDSTGRVVSASAYLLRALPPSGPARGDLAGTYPDPTIRQGAVVTDRIADGAVTTSKLDESGVTAGTYGSATKVPRVTIDAKGRVVRADSVAIVSAPPAGPAGGDLAGTYPNPTIRVGAVVTDRIADNAVTTPKIADNTVTTAKLNATGVNAGTYGSSNKVARVTVDAKGRVTSADSVLITGTTPGGAAGGDLAGSYPDPTIRVGAVVTDRIADNAVTTTKINDAAVTTAKINDAAVITSKIADDAVTTAKLNATGVNAGTYGSSNRVARVTVDAKGRVTSADSVLITGTTPGGAAGGDLAGTYPNPTIRVGAVVTDRIADNAVTTPKLNDAAVTTTKIADDAVTTAKLNATGVNAGTYGSSNRVARVTVDAKGRVTSADSVLITGTTPGGAAGGDLAGTYPNPTIRVGAVVTDRIADNAVTTTKINDAAVTTAKLNATGVNAGTYGSSNKVARVTVDAKGRVTSADSVLITGTTPGGAAGGDLAGTYPDPTIRVGAVVTDRIADNAVTTPKINDAAVTTPKIADDAVTTAKLNATGVNAGTYGSSNKVARVTVDAKGRVTSADSVLITGTTPGGAAGGDLAGTYPDPTIRVGAVVTDRIADNAVTTPKINDAAVTTAKIADEAVTTAKLNATGVNAGTYGSSNKVARVTVDTKGRVTSADSVLITGTTPGGAAGGDLAGTYPDPTIRVGAVVTDRIADNAVTTLKLNDAAVTTTKIADDAVTTAKLNATGVNAGTYGSSNKVARVTVDAKGRVTSADSVAIDVSSSSWMLEGNSLADSSTKWIGTQNTTPLVVKTNGAERMRVTGGGWVGIGTATPSAALHVAGKSILIDDDVKVGGNNRNTFLGREVFTIPTVGWGNVAVGNGAGRYLTGFANVAIGESALFRSTSDGNVSIGFMSMFESTAGWHNVAIGERAMQNATTGGDNIAIGWSALGNVGSGTSNLGVGGSALSTNSGSSNTAIGVAAASMQTSGNFNTFVGNSAGHGLLSGDFNTIIAVNYQNGTLGLTSGNANTIIGSRITGLPATLNNNIIIADGEGNRRFNADNLGRIGLGVNTPVKKLHVAGSKDSSDIRFDALAHSSTATTPTGSYGIVIADSLGNIHRATTESIVGPYAWLTNGNTIADSTTSYVGTSNNRPFVVKTNGAERMRVTAGGWVGIGTSNPQQQLQVTGDALINTLRIGKGPGIANMNVVVGEDALSNNINSAANVAIGNNALYLNTYGIDNTAVGWQALKSNTLGRDNVAVGRTALADNTTGSGNVAVGWNSLRLTGSSGLNTAIGHHSGESLTNGSDNVFMGNWTGQAIVSGSANTFLGSNSAGGVTTGNANTIIGAFTTGLPATLNNNIIIADGSGNRRFNADNLGRIGLGVNSPVKKLHVAGSKDSSDIRFDALAHSSTATTPTGSYGVVIADSLGNIHRKSTESLIGSVAWLTTGNLIADSAKTFIGTTNAAPLSIRTNNTERLRVSSDGRVGIGIATPLEQIHTSGRIRIDGDVLVGGANGNAFIGKNAGVNLTTGWGNVALGEAALAQAVSSVNNVAIGLVSLQLNTQRDNIAIGGYSQAASVTGIGNVSIGHRSLGGHKLGFYNVAVGFESIMNGESGEDNVAIGPWTLHVQNGTNGSTALGSRAGGSLQSGSSNTFIGKSSGFSLVSGSHNTILGPLSTIMQTGDNNTIIGSRITGLPATLNNNIVIADGEGNRRFNADNLGRIGLGVNSPLKKLHVAGSKDSSDIRFDALAHSSTATTPTGSYGVVIADSLGNIHRATTESIVGTSAWLTSGNSIADSTTSYAGTSNNRPFVVKTNGAERMRVTGGGWVGIGTATPSAALHVAGKSILIDDDVRIGGSNTNTFIGKEALQSVTSGVGNVAIGPGTLRDLTSGVVNVAIGHAALVKTNSQGNVAIGSMSLLESTTGWRNVAVGERSMQNATTGGENVAVGWSALGNVGSGTNNLGVGGSALGLNSGSWNTAVGVAAASTQTSGNFNTFVGHSAGHGLISGDFNTIVAVNYQNGTLGLTSGNANTIIGSRITGLPATLNNNIIIADGEGNRRVNIDNVGRIGLGVNSPLKKLHVAGSKDSSDIRFDALAHSSTATTPTGSYGFVIADSLGNIHRRSVESVSATASWALAGNSATDSTTRYLGTTDARPLVVKTNGSERMRVTGGGWVGVGTSTPQANLHVNGTARIGTNGTNLTQIIKAQVQVDPGNINAGGYLDLDLAVADAGVGSAVSVSPSADLEAGLLVAFARVSQIGTVRVRLQNVTAAAIDPNAVTFAIVAVE